MGNYCGSSPPSSNANNKLNLLDRERYKGSESLTYKVVLLGDVFVGKTSVLTALQKTDLQDSSYDPTIGFAFSQKAIPIDGGVS